MYTLKPALCLDLDGTIRRCKSSHSSFINDKDDMELFPGVEERIWEYKNKGYIIFGVTNQGGVAFGYKTRESLMEELTATKQLFDNDPFDMIVACPDHVDGDIEPYCHRSLCRKPEIGMLARLEEWAVSSLHVMIDWDHSIMVGDRSEDSGLAENAGTGFRWAHDFFDREPDG